MFALGVSSEAGVRRGKIRASGMRFGGEAAGHSIAGSLPGSNWMLSGLCVSVQAFSLIQTEPRRRGDRGIRKKLDRGLENQGNWRD